jgi:uncharacterized protein YaeQ
MALKATIFKAELQVSDMDRHYYGQHALTLARHPSETDERLMVRLLAFALYASDGLCFGRGISTDDEADLFEQDLTGQITHWIDVGTPDVRDIRKACGRAAQVTVVSYGRTARTWWSLNRDKLETLANLTLLWLPGETTEALAVLAARNMRIQCSLQDDVVWFTSGETTLQVEPVTLTASPGAGRDHP